MHTLTYAMREGCIHVHFLDMSRADAANNWMHNLWGVIVCVCTLVHVWSICLPSVFDGFSMEVAAGTFEWPLSERKPKGFKDVKSDEKLIMLQVDDVWRLVEMTVLLGFLMPYSYRWLQSRYHLGIVVHNVISAMYVIDIVRRHTHPHNCTSNALNPAASSSYQHRHRRM